MSSKQLLGLWNGLVTPARAIRQYVGDEVIVVAVLSMAGYGTAVLREVVTAREFGASRDLDAFLVAFTIPALLANLVGGVTEPVVIPEYVGHARVDIRRADEAAVSYSAFIMIAVLAFCLPLLLIDRWLISLIAPGFAEPSLHQATRMFVWLMPFVFLSGCTTICRSLLNARRRFAISTIAPALQAALVALTVVGLGARMGVESLVLGTLLGSLVVATVLVAKLWAEGFRFSWSGITFSISEHGRTFQTSVLLFFGGLVYQMNSVIVRMFASELAEGTVAAMNYAQNICLIVVLGVSAPITTVEFPRLSSLAAAGDYRAFARAFREGLLKVILLVLPFAIGFYVFGGRIVALLLERGNFTAEAREITAQSLAALAVGLVPLSIMWYCPRAVAALWMMKAATLLTPLGPLINALFAYLLVGRLQHTGVALAYSASLLYTAGFQVYLVERRVRQELRSIGR